MRIAMLRILGFVPFLMATPLSETGAAEFLLDDFDGYTDDIGLMDAGWEPMDVNTPSENATWTVLNPGGRLNPPTENGTPSAALVGPATLRTTRAATATAI